MKLNFQPNDDPNPRLPILNHTRPPMQQHPQPPRPPSQPTSPQPPQRPQQHFNQIDQLQTASLSSQLSPAPNPAHVSNGDGGEGGGRDHTSPRLATSHVADPPSVSHLQTSHIPPLPSHHHHHQQSHPHTSVSSARPPFHMYPGTSNTQPHLPARNPHAQSLPHLNPRTPDVHGFPVHPHPQTRQSQSLMYSHDYNNHNNNEPNENHNDNTSGADRYPHPVSIADSDSPRYRDAYASTYDRRYDGRGYDRSRAMDYDSDLYQSRSRWSISGVGSTFIYIFVTIVVICTPLALFNSDFTLDNIYNTAHRFLSRVEPRGGSLGQTIIWKGPTNAFANLRNETTSRTGSSYRQRDYSYSSHTTPKPSHTAMKRPSLWSRFVSNKRKNKRARVEDSDRFEDSSSQEDDTWTSGKENQFTHRDERFSSHYNNPHTGEIEANPASLPTATATASSVAAYLQFVQQQNNLIDNYEDKNKVYSDDGSLQAETGGMVDRHRMNAHADSDNYIPMSPPEYQQQAYSSEHSMAGNRLPVPNISQRLVSHLTKPPEHMYQSTGGEAVPPSYHGSQAQWENQVPVQVPQHVIPTPSTLHAHSYPGSNQMSSETFARNHAYPPQVRDAQAHAVFQHTKFPQGQAFAPRPPGGSSSSDTGINQKQPEYANAPSNNDGSFLQEANFASSQMSGLQHGVNMAGPNQRHSNQAQGSGDGLPPPAGQPWQQGYQGQGQEQVSSTQQEVRVRGLNQRQPQLKGNEIDSTTASDHSGTSSSSTMDQYGRQQQNLLIKKQHIVQRAQQKYAQLQSQRQSQSQPQS